MVLMSVTVCKIHIYIFHGAFHLLTELTHKEHVWERNCRRALLLHKYKAGEAPVAGAGRDGLTVLPEVWLHVSHQLFKLQMRHDFSGSSTLTGMGIISGLSVKWRISFSVAKPVGRGRGLLWYWFPHPMFNIQITFYRKKVAPSNIWQRVAMVESVVVFSIFFICLLFWGQLCLLSHHLTQHLFLLFTMVSGDKSEQRGVCWRRSRGDSCFSLGHMAVLLWHPWRLLAKLLKTPWISLTGFEW